MARLTTIGSRLATLDTRTSRPPPKTAEADLLTPEHKARQPSCSHRIEVTSADGDDA